MTKIATTTESTTGTTITTTDVELELELGQGSPFSYCPPGQRQLPSLKG